LAFKTFYCLYIQPMQPAPVCACSDGEAWRP